MPDFVPFEQSQEAARLDEARKAAELETRQKKEQEKISWFPEMPRDFSAGVNRRYDLDIHKKPDSTQPEKNVPGVDALTGYDELSDDLKLEALDKYPKLKDVSANQRAILYDNLKFKELFGNDPDYGVMKTWSKEARDAYYRDYVLNENIFNTYGNSVDNATWAKINNLSPESKVKLIQEGYQAPKDIEDRYTKLEEEYNKNYSSFGNALYSSALSAETGKSYGQNLRDQEAKSLKTNQRLLDKIATEDSDLKVNSPEVQERKDEIFKNKKIAYDAGEIETVDIDKEFEAIMGGSETAIPSSLYAAFRGGHELAHLDVDTKLKFISEYNALKEIYGEGDSVTSRDLNMQRYIHSQQNGWDWLEDVGVGIGTKAVAHLAQIGVALGAAGVLAARGEEGLANYLQGKKEDGSDLGWFVNPKYWNGVDQFGTFSPSHIDDIYNKYNGVNKHQWLTDVGRDLSFGTFAREGLKMAGYMVADYLLAKATGAVIPEAAAPYVTSALSSASIAEAYGSGAFDEVLQEEMNVIGERKAQDKADYLDEYFDGIKFQIGPRGTYLPPAKIEGDELSRREGAIVDILNSKIQEKLNNYLNANPELAQRLGEEQYDELRERFAQEAWDEYVKEVGDEYDNDPRLWNSDFNKEEAFAKRRAAGAYLTSSAIEFNRYMANNLTWRKFLMTDKMKSTLARNRGFQTMFDETGRARPAYEMGPFGMFTTENEKLFRWYKVAQSFWGSGLSNFNDDLTTNFAKKFAITRFNDFISSGYDIDKYLSTVDYLSTFASSLANGVAGLEEGFFDKRSWFDFAVGGSGMFGPAIKIGKSAGRYNRTDVEREARKANMRVEDYEKTDAFKVAVENGTIRPKSAFERFHDKTFVYIPAVQTYFDAGMEADMSRAGAEDINEQMTTFRKLMDVFKSKDKDIDAMSNIVAHLNAWEINDMSGNETDARDSKAQAAIQLAIELEKAKYDSALQKNKFMMEQNQRLQDIVDGRISEEERNTLIAEFLEGLDSGNQAVKSDPNIQNKEQYAWERIQENAQKMLDTQAEYSRIHEEITKSKEFAAVAGDINADKIAETLTANRMMLADRERRGIEMEKEIRGVGETSETTSSIAEYGTKRGLQAAIKEQEEAIKDLEANIKDLQDEVSVPLSRKQRRDERTRIRRTQREALLQIRKEELAEAKEKLAEMQADDVDFSKQVKANDILNLNPVQRAKMLDRENLGKYTKRQQREIKKAIDILQKKGMGLMATVQDAATIYQRNQELAETNRRMLADTKGVADYYRILDQYKQDNLEDAYFYRAYRESEGKYSDLSDETKKAAYVNATFSERGLDRLIKDHAEDKTLLESLRPVVRMHNNAVASLQVLFPEQVQEQTRNTLYEEINRVFNDGRIRSEKEGIAALERWAESQEDFGVRDKVNSVLNFLKVLGHQINATKPATETTKKEQEALKEQAEKSEKERKEADAPAAPASIENAPTTEVKPAGTEQAPAQGIPPASTEEAPLAPVAPASTELVTPSAVPPASMDFTPRANVTVVDSDGRVVEPSDEMKAALAAKEAGTQVIPLGEKPSGEAANEQISEQSDYLPGNALYEYDRTELEGRGVAVRKQVKKAGGALDRFFQWADSMKIKVQNIIDEELGNIIKKHPNLKVQFMVVRGEGSGDAMQRDVVLVTEYTEDIAKLHNKENGEPVQVGGKQYLVIGTLGYLPQASGQYNAFTAIQQTLGNRAAEAFKTDGVDYYVDEDMYTQISNFYAGRLVRQQVGEDSVEYRTLGEIFADKARNPNGLSFKNAIFGIMFGNKGFVPSRDAGVETVYPPGKSETNTGRVFLMVKAANGNYIPVAIKPAFFNELKEGSRLKDSIMAKVIAATSENLAERRKAIEELSTYLVLDDNSNILVGNEKNNTISIVRNGTVVKTWTLGRNFDRVGFINEFSQTPFQVNITMGRLKSETELRIYDEAGALKVDVSKLGTVNAAYDVYNIDKEGKPIIVKREAIAPKQTEKAPVYDRAAKVNGKTYRRAGEVIVDEFGKKINTDTPEGQQLETSAKYTMMIDSMKLSPIGKEGALTYYKINNAIVVGRDVNNNCKVIVGKKAKEMMDSFAREQAEKERQEAAAREAERIKAEEKKAKERLEEKPVIERSAEIQVGLSSTYQGFKQLDNSDTAMQDYRQKLSSPTHQTPRGKNVAVWTENGNTFFVVEIDGRTGDNYTFSVNRELYGEQVTSLINIADGLTRADELKQAIKDYLTEQPQAVKPEEPPIATRAEQTPSKPAEKAPKAPVSTKKSVKFVELIQSKRKVLNEIAKEKGWNWGKTPAEKEAFLVKKGILKNIGEVITMDMDSFCEMLKNCK